MRATAVACWVAFVALMTLLCDMATRLLFVKDVSRLLNMAMPKAPPIFLTRARMDEAMPISCGSTDEAMAFVLGPMPAPMKRAMRARGAIRSRALERASMKVRRKNASDAPAV